ncbi:MAG: PTS system mannose/fructose/sorbose family transporter subunit IID [Clostridiales bacterium]|nr:PTS system mannose/fructose/sorbose family transporter subunit IID [Clostridiales bacterium]
MGETNNTNKKLTKKDITKSMWIYYAGAELSNSYERLQSLVFCASMTPILKKLYSTDEDLSKALKRHLVFFNTEGILGAIIQGIVISMEEQKANGEDVTDDAITGIKTGLMGPVAGMGDAIIWAAVMPIIFSIFLPFASDGMAIGGIAPLILYPLSTIIISYYLIHNGYKLGKKSIISLLNGGRMKSIIFTANIIGLTMMGALSASYVTLTTPLALTFSGGSTIALQEEVLDVIAPGLLPLAAIFIIYAYLRKKGPRYTRILLTIVAVSVITAVLGIF